jgi:hypothetical protein
VFLAAAALWEPRKTRLLEENPTFAIALILNFLIGT